jgi:ssDNA-binding Zn-finger/Zn-ribbon topoisomerase 1
MQWLFLVLMAVGAVLFLLFKDRIQNTGSAELSYEVKAPFSAAERSFYGVLSQIVEPKYELFGKMRIADIISPRKGAPKSSWRKAFNRVSAKHFDFVICDKSDLNVLAVLELDDKSHSEKSRQVRDNLVESVCNSAGLPLIRIPARKSYRIEEIKAALHPLLGGRIAVPESVPKPPEAETAQVGQNHVCPKCNSALVKRVAKRGKYQGKEFWACSSFPNCKYAAEIKAT